MGVKLRKRVLKDRQRYYLDIHHDGRRWSEFLDLYTAKKGKGVASTSNNEESRRLAEAIRAKRELELVASDYNLTVPTRKNIDFFAYCEQYLATYVKKDERMLKASVKYLSEFAKNKPLPPRDITETYCESFKMWLDKHKNLSGETSNNYFAKFKKIIKAATKDSVFPSNPAADVRNKVDKQKISKDILSIDEIQALAKAQCGNSEVKRAFLFACNTGLRFCDIIALEWRHVNGGSITIAQQKTERKVTINLNASALKIIGDPAKRDDAIFSLPSHNAVLKNLRSWALTAKVNKHITFHVARHSFATNLLIHETDLRSVASLLGHSGLNHIGKYVRVVSDLKQRAVDRLPEISFED